MNINSGKFDLLGFRHFYQASDENYEFVYWKEKHKPFAISMLTIMTLPSVFHMTASKKKKKKKKKKKNFNIKNMVVN